MVDLNNNILESHKNNNSGKFSALPKRIASAIILVLIFVATLYMGSKAFYVLMMIASSVLLYEWLAITKNFKKKIIWYLFGIIYITPACVSLAYLSTIISPSIAYAPLVYLIILVVATDVGAYFSGKTIGGKKLAPKISPGKTWAGLIGGMASSAIASYLMIDMVDYPSNVISAICIGISVALLAQTGDLFESWLKRKAGVKDSGKIIPGHGGLFDRMDGLMLTAPFYLFLFVKSVS